MFVKQASGQTVKLGLREPITHLTPEAMFTKVRKKESVKSVLDYSEAVISVGIDVHKKRWSVCIMIGPKVFKEFSQESDSGQLIIHLERNYPGAKIQCAYEAGFSGFGLYEALVESGIDCLVIHPADVPTTDKERRQKRDRIDAKKIAQALQSGQLKGIYVHSREFQELRALVRTRIRLQRNISRSKNRIKSHLDFFGKKIPPRWENRNWSGKFISWLEKIVFKSEAGKIALDVWIDSLKSDRKRLADLDRKLKHMIPSPDYQEQMELLMSVPGVGQLSAWILLSEIGAIDRFKNIDTLASYIGLIPEVSSSGETERIGPMTHRGNPFLRFILIEAAWRAISKDPGLLMSYQKLTKRMKGQQAIVRIARKLLNRIRYVLINKVSYQADHPIKTSAHAA